MGRRRKQQDEAGLGLDSFVDIVANTLGILILLVMITMVTTEQKLIELTDEAVEHREWLSRNKDLYAELEDWKKSLSADELAMLDEYQQILKQNKDLDMEISLANNERTDDIQEKVRMVQDSERAAKESADLLANRKVAAEDAARRLEERQKELEGIVAEAEKVRIKVPAILLEELKREPADKVVAYVETKDIATTQQIASLETSLQTIADRIKTLTETDAKKELERIRAMKEQIDRENDQLLAQLKKLEKEYDDKLEQSEQLTLGIPRRESRAKKANRLYFECASTGVLFLYETNGRKMMINDKDYESPAEKTFPLTIKRTTSGEDAVTIWKGNRGDIQISAFEQRLKDVRPDEFDVVFIVRSNSDAYRHFRRARYVAEDQLGFTSQVNLLEDGDTLTLRQPSQSRRLLGETVAGGSKPDDSVSTMDVGDEILILASISSDGLVSAE